MNLPHMLGKKCERLDLKNTLLRLICLVAVIFFITSPLFSQTANGRISGTVKDQTGGAVVGAMVTVTDVARGLARNLTTDEAGAYLAPNLLPGTYTVHATYTGFQAWERANILLEVGADLAIDAVLQPGAQTQTITVTEELPMVNTTSATLGGTFSNQTINELPINGRNYQNLQELRPGVVLNLANDSNGAGAASVNGIRPESSNEYLVEGLHVMDPYTGQSVINNIGVNGDAATILPIDAIQEFNAQYNPKAEYGFKAGGSVGIGLKSGTNAFHGTGLAFFRADALDARSYFNTADQPKVNGNLRQWGATLGGPIKKDKLFFFIAYEQQNLTVGNPSRVEAPFTDPALLNCTTGPYACTAIANSVAGKFTPDASNHFILACLAIKNAVQPAPPAAQYALSSQSLSAVGLNPDCSPGANYPNPNFFVPHGATDHGAGNSANPTITSYFPNTQTNTLALGSLAKVDYQLNSQNSINGFFYKGVGESRDGQTNVRPEWRGYFHYHALVGAGSWTWLPNSSTANSFRVGYAYLHQPAEGVDTGDHPEITAAKLGIATGVIDPQNAGLPTIIPNGFYTLGSRQTEIQGPMTSLEINDQISYLRGNHSMKFGGSIIAEHQNGALWQNAKGSFAFGSGGNGIPAFLAGQNPVPVIAVSGGTPIAKLDNGGLQTVTFLYGDPRSHVSRTSYSLFVQDDFRIRPRLTLNLGLRYEVSSVLSDRDHILGGFDPQLGIVQEGIQIPAIMSPDRNNFSPRLGFAWDIQGNGKTVLRASGSIINELVTMRTYLDITPSLAQMPTAWIIGCTTATTTAGVVNPIPGGAASNCGGTLLTSGGTRDAGTVSYTASAGTLTPIKWDGPINGTSATILPTAGLHSCSPSVAVADVISPTSQAGRVGAPCTINYADRKTAAPYVESWNLSIQRALRSNVSLEVAYVGNHGVKLIGKTDLNQAPSGPVWNAVIASGANAGKTLLQVCNATMTVATCQPGSLGGNQGLYTTTLNANRSFVAKFPYLQAINRIWNRDVSNYDGLQVSLTARNYHGVSAQAGYTWAHALDIGSDNTSGAGSDAYHNNLDYGSANSDLRHRFTFAPAYNIPGKKGFGGLLEGWRLNGNFKYQTGRAWTPTDTRDFYGTGKGSRWDFFGDPSDFQVNLAGQNNAGFYPGCPAVGGVASCTTLPAGNNPRTGVPFVAADLAVNNSLCSSHAGSVATLTAFGCWVQGGSVLTPPALNTFGNTTKGRFRGPSFWNLDMSVTKRQTITERLAAEFRGEFFNPFNHPNFSQPTGISVNSCSLASCTFGQTSNTPNVTATNALIGSGGPRRIQFGVKLIF